MPISEKILKEINALQISRDEKELLIDILTLEEKGISQFRKEYEKQVKAFHKAQVSEVIK